MKYSSRFFLYAPLALFLSLAAGTGVYWWIVAGALSARLDAMNGREAMPGVTLRFTSKSVSGFPFNLDVLFAGLSVTVKTPHGPASWTTEKFAMHGLTYGREQFIYEAAGRQALRWTDLAGKPHAMPFEVGDLHASTISGRARLSRFDLDCVGFGSPALTAGRVQIQCAGRAARPVARSLRHRRRRAPVARVRFAVRAGHRAGQARRVRRAGAAVRRPARGPDRLGERAGDLPRGGWRAPGERSGDRVEPIERHGQGPPRARRVAFGGSLLDFKIAGIETLLDTARRHGVRGNPNGGIASALLDRAALAGNNEAGLLGAVVGFHGGVVSVGGEPATTEEPLY